MINTTIKYLILSVICIALQLFMYRNKIKYMLLVKIAAIFFTGLTIIYINIITISYIHGADFDALQKLNLIKTITAIKNTPVPDRNINKIDQENNILIYYRFGCKDCEAIYVELKEILQDKQNIYWIASRQKTGKKLLEKYIVEEVPAGVIIQKNENYISYVLYTTKYNEINKKNEIILNNQAIERLIYLQNNN